MRGDYCSADCQPEAPARPVHGAAIRYIRLKYFLGQTLRYAGTGIRDINAISISAVLATGLCARFISAAFALNSAAYRVTADCDPSLSGGELDGILEQVNEDLLYLLGLKQELIPDRLHAYINLDLLIHDQGIYIVQRMLYDLVHIPWQATRRPGCTSFGKQLHRPAG